MAKLKKSVSIKDIANALNVSTTLVSFVLNGKAKQHRVNDDLAKRVLEVADEMGYRPNILAKSLRDGRTRSLGIVFTDISNPFFAHLAKYIEKVAETYNYTVQFASTDEKVDRMEKVIDSMYYRGIDGFIIVPSEGSENFISGLVAEGMPIVLMDRDINEIPVSCICLDNKKAGYEGTKHLIAQGFKDIGFVAYDMKLQHMYDRVDGYRQAMIEAGLEDHICIQYVNFNNMEESSDAAVEHMVNNNVRAIFFASNGIATECMKSIERRKIRIPSQIAVMVFDGGDVFSFYHCSITYIEQPLKEIAQNAVDSIIDILEKRETEPKKLVIEGQLIIGQSSLNLSGNGAE